MKYILHLFDEEGSPIAHLPAKCRSEIPSMNEKLELEGDIKGTYEVKGKFTFLEVKGVFRPRLIEKDVPIVKAYRVKE